MRIGIVAYQIKKVEQGILITRACSNIENYLQTTNWDEAVSFLTEDKGKALHICWSLKDFTNSLFSLLPEEKRMELGEKARVFVGDTKLFNVNYLLGITTTKHIKGNFYQRLENNLYQLKHWMPDGTPEPSSIAVVTNYGENILKALEQMKVYPDKLTSPVATFLVDLSKNNLPTIYSFNEDWLDAQNYAGKMMRCEWRSAFKLGYWNKTWCYDLVSAYPSIMANLPNTDYCSARYSKVYLKSDWGIVKGRVEITTPVSPLVFDTGDGYICPVGVWKGYFTTEEIDWLERWQAGRFILEDGWFFHWKGSKPYHQVISRLLALRQTGDPMVVSLAKKMALGMSGKLDEDHKDGNLGELYNPILAAITRSRCRLAVADFIYTNNIMDNLIAVMVDGILVDKEVPITESGYPGTWRLESQSPALVLGKGEVWRPSKKPLGISFVEIVGAIKKEPDRSCYEFNGGKRIIDLLLGATDLDRDFPECPKTGRELISGIYSSNPLKLSSFAKD